MLVIKTIELIQKIPTASPGQPVYLPLGSFNLTQILGSSDIRKMNEGDLANITLPALGNIDVGGFINQLGGQFGQQAKDFYAKLKEGREHEPG